MTTRRHPHYRRNVTYSQRELGVPVRTPSTTPEWGGSPELRRTSTSGLRFQTRRDSQNPQTGDWTRVSPPLRNSCLSQGLPLVDSRFSSPYRPRRPPLRISPAKNTSGRSKTISTLVPCASTVSGPCASSSPATAPAAPPTPSPAPACPAAAPASPPTDAPAAVVFATVPAVPPESPSPLIEPSCGSTCPCVEASTWSTRALKSRVTPLGRVSESNRMNTSPRPFRCPGGLTKVSVPATLLPGGITTTPLLRIGKAVRRYTRSPSEECFILTEFTSTSGICVPASTVYSVGFGGSAAPTAATAVPPSALS